MLHKTADHEDQPHASTYSTRYFTQSVPKFQMPEDEMPAHVAYQLCHDELSLDGNPSLNLASFVTTWMEPEAEKLIVESLNKNFVDQDEYPQTVAIQERCVNMIAHLFHAPRGHAVGTSTVGSSEAVMLGALSHKWNWRKRMQAAGRPTDRPNIVMGGDVQVVWDKYARYFDVEPRIIPLQPNRFTITPEEVVAAVDENTTCVVGVLGTTFTGQIDPLSDICAALDDVQKKRGWDIPVHVDAASGGFVAPFIDPHLKWDFRLPRVVSINVSGHKYGLVYPGVGWIIWRNAQQLPEELVFRVNYLGGDMPTFNLNFSRGATHVLAQYYNFIRLGRGGYRRIMENLMANTRYLSAQIREQGWCDILSDDKSLPLVAGKVRDGEGFTVFELSQKLRERGWIVPAYTLPPNAEHVAVFRVVIRESFSRDMAEMLAEDIHRAVVSLRGLHKADGNTHKGRRHRVC